MKERIKILRKSLGLTLEEFGDRLGVTKTAISLLENGKNSVTVQMRKAICREFNVSEEWILNGTGPMERAVTYDEEVAMYTQDILMDVESGTAAAIREFIVIYGKLDSEGKAFMDDVIHKIADSVKKSREES